MSSFVNPELVIIESPFNGTPAEVKENVRYAILAMRDCLSRGEAPYASHLLYTQTPNGYIPDDVKDDVIGRDAGINAGLAWGAHASKTVVYTDRGISKGMQYGIAAAKERHRPVEYRTIDNYNNCAA